MKVLKYGGRGVEIALLSASDPGPDTVFWSKRSYKPDGEVDRHGHNSFVIVADVRGGWLTKDGVEVALLSVNGIGEIRWSVSSREYDHCNAEGAIEHFGLTPLVLK